MSIEENKECCGSNGKHEDEKCCDAITSPAQMKLDDMKANPDDYVHIKDLVIATKIQDGKLFTLLNPVTSDDSLEIALTRLQREVFNFLNYKDMIRKKQNQEEKKLRNTILDKGNGIMGFVRGGKKR